MILKILLKIKVLFDKSEPRYLLNILFIDDYCIFIQNIKEDSLIVLAKEINSIKIQKEDIDINLNEIENQAMEILNEEFEKKL